MCSVSQSLRHLCDLRRGTEGLCLLQCHIIIIIIIDLFICSRIVMIND